TGGGKTREGSATSSRSTMFHSWMRSARPHLGTSRRAGARPVSLAGGYSTVVTSPKPAIRQSPTTPPFTESLRG
ncbi:hypothetical protein, partial [Nocardia sp. NPDC127526]|uniref:hypothetical protein n=1 Tax=Nocardia sp. NPDC127526 TaxID=3345393 RepID=UPI0036292B49